MFVCNAGRCYCHGGRWNNHPGGFCFADVIAMVADGITTGQPLFQFLVLRWSTEPHPYVWQMELAYISI